MDWPFASLLDFETPLSLTRLFLGCVLATGIAGLAYRLRSLDSSGALAAILVGTIIFGIGGLPWAILLLTFFITSSGWSQAFRRRKQSAEEKYAKGHQRDAGQVLANGGLAALFALLHAFFPHHLWPWIGFIGALAAVNADTWATELGVLNPHPPRRITDLRRRVEPGSSGGVSPLGTLAALAGSGLIATLGVWLSPQVIAPVSLSPLRTATILTLAGTIASLVDSLLGATVQAIYYCPLHQKETERHPLHSCGTPTTHLRGWRWLNNDGVNLVCSLVGATIAWLALF